MTEQPEPDSSDASSETEPLVNSEPAVVNQLEHDERVWKLRNLRIDTVIKVLSVLGITFAGIGVWQRWREDDLRIRQAGMYREDAENLEITLQPRVEGGASNTPFIITDVKLRNIGKVPIRAYLGADPSEDQGLELSVLEYDESEQGMPTAESKVIDWHLTGKSSVYVVQKYNMLGEYTSFQQGTYLLNPGVTYRETIAVPAKSGRFYGVRVRFFAPKWTAADFDYIYVPSRTSH